MIILTSRICKMTISQLGPHVFSRITCQRRWRCFLELQQHLVVVYSAFDEKRMHFWILCMFSFSFAGQQWHSNVVQNLHVGNYLPQVKSEENISLQCGISFRVGCCIFHIAFCSVLIVVVPSLVSKDRYQNEWLPWNRIIVSFEKGFGAKVEMRAYFWREVG